MYLCNMNTYIKEILTRRGITQNELAEMLGVKQPTVSATISRPSFPTLERIATALNVEPWQLLAPPSVVEELKQARQQRDDFTAFVRMNGKNYTPQTFDELVALVDMLRR